MTCQHKTLILTSTRSEDGSPVYACAGDLRELIAKWRSISIPGKGIGSKGVFTSEIQKACADELEAALKPSACGAGLFVVKPLEITASYAPGAGMSDTVWLYEKNPKILEPNADGCVHKLWWTDLSGKRHYAEAYAKTATMYDLTGPWTEGQPPAEEPKP